VLADRGGGLEAAVVSSGSIGTFVAQRPRHDAVRTRVILQLEVRQEVPEEMWVPRYPELSRQHAHGLAADRVSGLLGPWLIARKKPRGVWITE